MPLLSVIVPIYNVEKYLDRCLQSVIGQTLSDLEIILVDDESPDNCPSMCDDYAKRYSNIKVIHKKNGGLGYARNSGLELATGKYVAFLDSDDWVEKEAYEQLCKEAEEKDLQAVYFAFQRHNGTQVIGHHTLEKTERFCFGREQVDDFLLDMVGTEPSFSSDVKIHPSSCGAIYRLDVFQKNHLQFVSERVIASEDAIFQVDFLSKVERIGYLPRRYYNYFVNENSISHTKNEDKIVRLKRFIQEMEMRLSKLYSEERYRIRLQRRTQHYFRIGLHILMGANEDKSLKEKLSKIKMLCQDETFRWGIEHYPIAKLPLKHRLFCRALQYKSAFLLYLITKMK